MARARHVLFVEDEQYRNAKLVRYLQAKGLEVTPAGTLAEAVSVAGAGEYGCVLLDVMLPPGDGDNDEFEALTAGVEFLRRLRTGAIAGADPHLPVVVLTGRPESAVEEEMRGLGVNAFINKPESMGVLLGAIESAIED